MHLSRYGAAWIFASSATASLLVVLDGIGIVWLIAGPAIATAGEMLVSYFSGGSGVGRAPPESDPNAPAPAGLGRR
jgi:hypothetical protein